MTTPDIFRPQIVLGGVFRGRGIGRWPPFGRTSRLFALKNIDELSLIDRSFNWLNLATHPKLNLGMKCTAVTAQGACRETQGLLHRGKDASCIHFDLGGKNSPGPT
jgi:hypothetical protein